MKTCPSCEGTGKDNNWWGCSDPECCGTDICYACNGEGKITLGIGDSAWFIWADIHPTIVQNIRDIGVVQGRLVKHDEAMGEWHIDVGNDEEEYICEVIEDCDFFITKEDAIDSLISLLNKQRE